MVSSAFWPDLFGKCVKDIFEWDNLGSRKTHWETLV